MSSVDEQMLDVVVRLEDPGLADELESWLNEAGADDVEVVHEQGVMDLVIVTIMFLFTAPRLAALGFWFRDKTRCRTIYDVRHDTVQLSQDCGTRDGRMIMIDSAGHVQVYEPERPADLNQVLLTLLGHVNE